MLFILSIPSLPRDKSVLPRDQSISLSVYAPLLSIADWIMTTSMSTLNSFFRRSRPHVPYDTNRKLSTTSQSNRINPTSPTEIVTLNSPP